VLHVVIEKFNIAEPKSGEIISKQDNEC